MNSGMTMKPKFFRAASGFRDWLEKHRTGETVLWVGYYKKGCGKPSMTWSESVDEALCFGWIDGVRKRIDDDRYMIRFSPRKRASTWSAVNIRMVAKLEAAGKMTEAGRAAFAARKEGKSRIYSYEQKGAPRDLDASSMAAFKKNKQAWAFFEAQPAGYRRKLAWWVMQAKQEQTRKRWLAKLMERSAAGKRLA
jgi:uncharacterized protein YdeI (YjbR/CyaY-like superfamily)